MSNSSGSVSSGDAMVDCCFKSASMVEVAVLMSGGACHLRVTAQAEGALGVVALGRSC